MPRSNIPFRSMRYFSNRKHNSVSRSHIKRSSGAQPVDDQEGQPCPVNNILVLPKNSETTINVISSNNRSCSHGDLFKKIRGRKRKEKQRLKKKHNFEDDVKPVITKVNSMDSERMKPRLNKHIIFLSDSDDENDMDDQKKPDASSTLAEIGNCEEDDDVIFVETPAAEIIEIDDGTEQNESVEDVHNNLDKSNDQENSLDTNDFLDNADINLKSKFNFELHGSEFKGAEFLKPSVPVDVSESGSHSSISDVSASIGMNVFNVCDFPQEKDNLFDDNNLEKFRKSITPQRPSKKSRNISKDDTPEYRRKTNDALPILSDIQEETNNRKQRGRSIIKELVNDRAHALLFTAQKKLKNKKRKSKDELSDTLEEENVSDSQELMKRKKKKKLKKQDTISEEINFEITNSSFGINTVDDGKNKKQKEADEDGVSEVSTNLDTDSLLHINKKSKKSKRQHSDAIVEEEKKKKKSKKVIEETSDGCARKSENEKSQNLPEECYDERKKKKNKKASEINNEHGCAKKDSQHLDVCIQGKNEEKKKKKSKKNISIEVSEEVAKENLEFSVNENESLITRKNKSKQLCNEPISESDDTQEKNCIEGSTSFHNKELNEIEERSEVILKTTENIVNAGEKNSIKDQVLSSGKISVDTDERKVMIENVETCKVISETLTIDQFSSQIPEFKNTKELRVSIVESEGNEKPNISQNNEEYIAEKVEQNYGETPAVSYANIGKVIQNDSHNLVLGFQENSGDQKKKKTKRILEVSVESFEPKRIKLINEKITNNVDEIALSQNDETIIEDVKEHQIDELSRINDITEKNKSPEVSPNLENEPSQNKIADKALEGHDDTECMQNISKNMEEKESVRDNIEKNILEENNSIGDMKVCISDVSRKADNFHFEDPMVVVDTEGNVDMKIVKVFSTGTKSIFSEENNFTDDVVIDNFLDKRVASWNPHPSKFASYNESLFNDGNRWDKIIEDPIKVTFTEETMTTNESLNKDLQPSQTSALECAVPTITLQDNVEMATLQEGKNDTNENCSFGITPDENFKQDISVKVEEESNDEIELALKTNSNVTLQNTKKSSTFNSNPDSESINEELPNEIEEIFKEKENHNTVKRLCEFLEEVNDPNDVLKKVSLLKQAFRNKVQHMVRTKEVVKTSNDDDDDDDDEVLSISSSTSSVMCLEDSVSVVSIDDDITLANCDLPDSEKNEKSTDNIPAILQDTNNALGKNDDVEIYQNQSISNSTLKSCETTQKGLDQYEVEDIQETMSDDPKLWKIFIEDVNPPKLPTKGKRCIKCKEIGHLGYNCPNKLNLPNCALCGMEGHLDFRCPNRICIQCGRKAPMLQNFCDHCKHYKNLTCTLCKNKGHPKNKCPDFWRRYHLTVTHGPLVQREALKLKEKKNLWCSSCARCGHLEYECKTSCRKIKNYQSFDPRVHQYEDIYKTEKKTSNLEYVQPNIEEVPQITQLIPNNGSTSSSSSSIPSSSENLDRSLNTSVVASSNAEHLNQSIDSTAEGLNTLPPEFEVIDEVNEETKGTVENITNPQNHTLFMTGSIGSLKHFLSTELTFLETFKFDIRNIHLRFFAFLEDDKRIKCRFPISRKRQFYRELNMLLFGKLHVKCGRVHKDKLKHFVNSTVDSLTVQTRESLYYSYDYIFRDKLHDHVNYQFFMKMIRQNYGNQRWIH